MALKTDMYPFKVTYSVFIGIQACRLVSVGKLGGLCASRGWGRNTSPDWNEASPFTNSRPTLLTEFMVHLVNMGLVSVDIAIGVVCIIIFCIPIRQGSQTGPRVGILCFVTYFSSREQSYSFRFVVIYFSN
jgi:hypothetical protein